MFLEFVKKAITEDDVKQYGTDRLFHGLGTVNDGKDIHDEEMEFEEAWKKTKFWHANGGEILFEHSNKPIGRSLRIARIPYKGTEAIEIFAMCKSGNEFFDNVWKAILGTHPSLKLNGLSMGGLRKAHRIDCTDTECHKVWHMYDILEYSAVFDPAKKSALILGAYSKNANGIIEINDPMPHWEDVYKGVSKLTGSENNKELKKGKDGNCDDCPPNEAELKKGAGSETKEGQTPESPQGNVSLDMNELTKGIQTLVQNEIKTSLEAFSKSFGEEVGKTIGEQLTKINSEIADLKKTAEGSEAEEKKDEDKETAEKDEEMEKGEPAKPNFQFNLSDYIKVGQTPEHMGSSDISAQSMKKSKKDETVITWRDTIKELAKVR